MFSLEQNGENLMISLEIDLERFGTHLKKVRKSNFLMINNLEINKVRTTTTTITATFRKLLE